MSLRARLVTGSLYTLVSSLAVYGIAMVTTVIYARLLGPTTFGVLGIFLTLGATIIPFASLGLNTGVAKYVAELAKVNRAGTEAILSVALTLTLVTGGVLSVVYFLLAEPLAGLYGQPALAVLIRLSASFLLVNTLGTFTQAVIQGLQEIRRLAALNVSVQALGIPITFGFVSAFGLLGAALGGIAFVCVTLVASLAVVRPLLRARALRIAPAWDRSTAKRLVRFSSPLILSSLLMRPALLFVASLIALWLTYESLSYYRIAGSLYRVVLLLPAVLSVPLLPAISEAYATQSRERTRAQLTQLLRLTMFLSLPLALLMGLGAPVWIAILYGGEYAAAALLLFVLSFAAMIDTLSSICENTLIGTERTWFVLALNVGQVAALVFGTIVLVPIHGVLGAGYASVIASAVYFAGALGELTRRREIVGRALTDIAALSVGAFAVSTLVVSRLGLGNLPATAVVMATVLAALAWRLSPRDRSLLRSAVRGALGVRGGP